MLATPEHNEEITEEKVEDQKNETKCKEEEEESSKGRIISIAGNGEEEEEEEEEEKRPKKKAKKSKTKYTTFQIIREHKWSIKGNSYTFKFIRNNECEMSSKCKGRYPEAPMPIVTGSDVHLSKPGEYYLVPEKSSTCYELRKDSVDGQKLMATQILHNAADLNVPRIIVSSIDLNSEGNTLNIITKKPKKGSNGFYTLNFRGKKALPSEKNSIFVAQGNEDGPNVISVRKTAKNKIDITADATIPDIIAFSMGLVLFTGNLGC